MTIGGAPQLNTNAIEDKEKIKLRILYAEDYQLTRELLTESLEERYSVVESVSNGQLLMEKLLAQGAKYDCVVTDNNMPLKTGLQALQEIRKIKGLEKLPVIMLTGDDLEIGDKVEALGAICIGKPVSEKELYTKIEELALSK